MTGLFPVMIAFGLAPDIRVIPPLFKKDRINGTFIDDIQQSAGFA